MALIQTRLRRSACQLSVRVCKKHGRRLRVTQRTESGWLTHLLRIGVTSGKAGRWAGTRADLKTPDAPDGGWINAATEVEWAEWEKKVNVKDKVENWKMRLETQEELVSQIIKGTWQSRNLFQGDNTQFFI
jgi:hypothetical protein